MKRRHLNALGYAVAAIPYWKYRLEGIIITSHHNRRFRIKNTLTLSFHYYPNGWKYRLEGDKLFVIITII